MTASSGKGMLGVTADSSGKSALTWHWCGLSAGHLHARDDTVKNGKKQQGGLTISAKLNFLSGFAASEATTVSKIYCTPASCMHEPDSAGISWRFGHVTKMILARTAGPLHANCPLLRMKRSVNLPVWSN